MEVDIFWLFYTVYKKFNIQVISSACIPLQNMIEYI